MCLFLPSYQVAPRQEDSDNEDDVDEEDEEEEEEGGESVKKNNENKTEEERRKEEYGAEDDIEYEFTLFIVNTEVNYSHRMNCGRIGIGRVLPQI